MVPGMAGIQMSQPISVVQTIPLHEAPMIVQMAPAAASNGVNAERNMLLSSILQREPQEPAR
jgi:hypothetical protein